MILARKTTKLSLDNKVLEVIISERRKENTAYFYSIEFIQEGFCEVLFNEKITKEQAEEIMKKWRKK